VDGHGNIGQLIVLCAKVNTWEVDAKRVWDGATPEVQNIMAGAIDQYYRDRPQTQRDEVTTWSSGKLMSFAIASKSKPSIGQLSKPCS
jgi:hypothetical protein